MTKFSKASVCWFTVEEFDSLFSDRLPQALAETKPMGIIDKEAAEADLRDRILDWYDGCTRDGRTRVLNPWPVLNFFDTSKFSEYWYASGGASFSADLIKDRQIDLASFSSCGLLTDGLNAIDAGTKCSSKALLFQAGCLTVDRILITGGGNKFCLRFPNLDVQAAMAARLWLFLKKPLKNASLMKRQAQAMLEALHQRQADEFQTAFKSFLSRIPLEVQRECEACCGTVFLMVMAGQEYGCQQSVGSGRRMSV